MYDVSHEDDIKKFVSEIVAGNPTGIINYYVVDVHGVPLVQFIVLKYRDFSECLLGYGAGDEIANAETVFLIRNDAVCEYLIQVFNVYRRLMEPSLKSPSGPRLPEGPVGPPSTA